MKIRPKIWNTHIDPDYYEIFIEEGIENYEDGSDCSRISIFRAEDDNRIVGIGFYIESLRR